MTAAHRIYTCTPIAFHANDFFFIRDSGLISQTLLRLGVESKAIMPLPWYDDDRREDTIRVEYAQLESEAWWRSLHLDGLVLYSWAAPRYRRIARAIHRAGIRLVIHLDSSGQFHIPFPPHTSWWKKAYTQAKEWVQDYFRARHMRYADVLTMGEPVSEYLRHRPFYGPNIADKCHPMPCPISSSFHYQETEKLTQILCIGRWDDVYQKRPEMLMQTLDLYYRKGGTASTLIYGTLTETLQQWHRQHENRNLIHLKGSVPNHTLKQAYLQSKVLLCTSLFESSHIVSAEALCCGCSIVAPNRPKDLRCVLWYTTRQSGTVAQADTPAALAEALEDELQQWEKGQRDPASIASAWSPHFHADHIMKQIFGIGKDQRAHPHS